MYAGCSGKGSRQGTASPCHIGTGATAVVDIDPHLPGIDRLRAAGAREGRYALDTGCPARSTDTASPATGMPLPARALRREHTIPGIPASRNARRPHVL
jgi:hypothetical protein